MVLRPHRITPNRDRELRERAWALAERRLAGRVLCGPCRATAADYVERCRLGDDNDCAAERAFHVAFKTALAELRMQVPP